MVPPLVMEEAQRRGRKVHLACQYYDEGILDINTVDDTIKGFVFAYIRFREDCKIKPIDIEKPLLCNRLKYAGTPDLVCWISGKRAIIDRKTAQTMSPSMGLQTAGYKILRESLFPKEFMAERYGLRLQSNEKYKLFPHDRTEDLLAFRDCLELSKSKTRVDEWRGFYGISDGKK